MHKNIKILQEGKFLRWLQQKPKQYLGVTNLKISDKRFSGMADKVKSEKPLSDVIATLKEE